MNEIFIPGQIPSLKNSKVKTKRGIFPSKTVMSWLRTFGIQSYSSRKKEVNYFKTIKGEYNFLDICKPLFENIGEEDYPIKLGFYFIRKTKGAWDFNNANQIITDLFTAFNLIPDDNVYYLLPFPLEKEGNYWHIDKENPGVIIKLLT